MSGVPTPVRASVRDLLGDLVGKPVTVAPSDPLLLTEDSPAYAATYRFDDGRVAALAVCDLATATALAAAIGFMTRADAQAELGDSSELTGDLFDFFREVVNVLAKLLNSPTSPHVVLREVDRVPGQVRADIGRVALRPRDRADYAVSLEGFDAGALAVLTA